MNYSKMATLLLASASMITVAAAAQDQTDAAAQADQEDQANTTRTLDKIVVSAEKREKSLQDTPLAVTAVDQQELEDRGVTEISELGSIAPNVTYSQSSGTTSDVSIYIRGLGQPDPILSSDSPVGLYIDGVNVARTTGASFELVDLERVEVLRGPQGTLFGRNTVGGAVSLITKGPAEEFGGTAQIGFGNLGYQFLRTTLDTGRLGDSGLAFKASYVHRERNGFFDDLNQPDERDGGSYKTDAFRIAASYDQGGPFTARYAYDFSDKSSVGNGYQLGGVSPALEAFLAQSPLVGGETANFSTDFLPNFRSDVSPLEEETQGHNLTLNYQFNDNITLRSITGYRKTDAESDGNDLDGTSGLRGFFVSPAIFVGVFQPLGFQDYDLLGGPDTIIPKTTRGQSQFSQEINLLGEYDDFNFVLGGYYFEEDANEALSVNLVIPIPNANPFPFPSDVDGSLVTINAFGVRLQNPLSYEHESESAAIFGQLTYNVSDRFRLTGGLRSTFDEKRLTRILPVAENVSSKSDRVNWLVSADYDVSDDTLAYARVSTGYRAGGTSARDDAGSPSFEPEDLTAYEVGLKTEFWENRARLNIAAFFSDYDNVQIGQFQPGTGGTLTETINAGKYTLAGIEAEFLANLTDNLTFNAAIGYVERDFKEFLITDATGAQIDRADETVLSFVPDLTANAGIEYNLPVDGFGTFRGRVDWLHRGDFGLSLFPVDDPLSDNLPGTGYDLLNARLTLTDLVFAPENIEVSFFADNITDEMYRVDSVDFGALGYSTFARGAPQTYGAELKFKF